MEEEIEIKFDSTLKVSKEEPGTPLPILPKALEAGTVIGERYKVIGLLGRGAMGAVYRVEHLFLGKQYALKVLAAPIQSDTTIRRFQNEARAASRLDHPNIAKATDFGMLDQQQPYFVMDLVEGVTLSKRLKIAGPLSLAEVLAIFVPVLDALHHAHEKGIIHRDIKPSNIVLTECPDMPLLPKLVDFGIARVELDEDSEGSPLTKTGEVFGTPLYMSPEQCAGVKVDARSDIYSLGCVLFEVLAGTPPFTGDGALQTMMKHMQDQPSTLRQASLGGDFPEAIETVISKMLAKKPEDRYQNCLVVAHELTNIREQRPLEAHPHATVSQRDGDEKQNKLHGAVILGGILIAFVAGAFVLSVPPKRSQLEVKQAEKNFAVPNSGFPHKPSDQEMKRTEDFQDFLTQVSRGEPVVVADGYAISDQDLNELQSDKRLGAIKLDHTSIGDKGFHILGQQKGLVSISADYTQVTDQGIKELIALPNLESLHVSANKLTNACIPYLAQIRKLKELSIRDAKIDDTGLKGLSELKLMQSIQLNRTQITDAGIKTICENFPNLSELHARSNKGITVKSLKYLGALPHLKKLTLSNCSISPREMSSFFVAHPQTKEVASYAERIFLDDSQPPLF